MKMNFSLPMLCILIVISISGCVSENDDDGMVYLNHGDVLPEDICKQNSIYSRVIALHQTGCGACDIALPRLENAAENLGISVEEYNLRNEEDLQVVKNLGFFPYYTPTILIKCKAYGTMTEEEYENLLEEVV